MSRHRNLRKVSLGDDDYDDEITQSYDEKYAYAISPSTSEMYMFNRNNQSQNISQFIKGQILEENNDDIMNEFSNLKDEDKQLNKNESISSPDTNDPQKSLKSKMDDDFMFQMDKEPNFRQQTSAQKPKEATVADSNFNSLKRREDLKNESSHSSPKFQSKSKANTKTNDSSNKSSVKIQASYIGTSNQSDMVNSKQLPAISDLKISSSASSENFRKMIVVDKEQLLKAYGEHTAGKDVINLIVIGHVDAGKSTLMGHLLYQLGQVSNKLMHKYKQESQIIGRSSFAFAWILDETDEERSRGVTIDVAQTKFETEKKIVNLLDAPGHKDFIPNMITGAGQADCAILVINSITGEFETGFELGGQTREHSLLVKSLGVSQLIVAINKMDMCEWSQERFMDITKKLGNFLIKQVGFKDNDIIFVPCSGLIGENLKEKCNNPKLTEWYNDKLKADEKLNVIGGLTLLDCINRFKPSERPIDKPLRFSISDVFKSLQSSSISLAGKLESGTVKCGDRVCIVPSNETGIVKSIALNDEQSLNICFAGDSVVLNVSNVDINKINIGNFLCDVNSPPMPISDKIKARIILFNLDIPLIKGFPVVFHYKTMNEAASIKKIISQLDKNSGEVIKEKPRFLTKGMSAIVEIKINRPLCMELFQNFRELGRFMLRYSDTTIAAGLITEIL